MPDEFAVAVKEYLRAKIEQRAPEVTIEKEGKPAPQVINIMDALKKSIQAKVGRTKVTASVRDKLGKGRSRHSRLLPVPASEIGRVKPLTNLPQGKFRPASASRRWGGNAA